MLFEGAVACLLIALLAGGRPSRLARLQIRHGWAFLLGFALQAALIPLALKGYPLVVRYAGAIHTLSFVPLFWGLWANRHQWPLQVVAVGVLMNFLVIAANGGRMPADARAVTQVRGPRTARLLAQGRVARHAVLRPHTPLGLLADRYALPRPYPWPCVFSAGDVVITLGVGALILVGMGAFGLGGKSQEAPASLPK